MKGIDLFVSVMVCTFVICLTSGLNPYIALTQNYMPTAVGFMQNYFLIFVAGAVLGKIMEVTGGAAAVAGMVTKVSKKNAYALIPIVAGILTYGGVHCFVAMFAVTPIALALYREADLPRRFMPASIFFGAATFGMVAPGTPQIQNVIPCTGMGVDYMAGMIPGFIATFFVAIVGTIWLKKMIDTAKANGEHFDIRESDVYDAEENREYPNGMIALIPLIVTVCLINIRINGATLVPLEGALCVGSILAIILMYRFIDIKQLPSYIGMSAKSALGMIFSICIVTGFGGVVKASPSFQELVDLVVNIPGPPLVGAAVGTTVLAGICGSASGGLGIIVPILSPVYLAQNVSAGAVARVMSLASSALDSIPHNGTVVTVIKDFCGETHKGSYMPIFWLSVFLPTVATILAVIIFTMFPFLN